MDFYQVLNRGVEKRNIVVDEADRLRFMQGLYLYNDKQLVDRNVRRLTPGSTFTRKRELLVHIHAYCLMDNHYHLLLSPIDDDPTNLSAYMRKLNMGYAKYFNEKYERSGSLWQGKYKSIPVVQDSHFMYIPYYIHLNPLDYVMPEWREGGVKNTTKALEYLQQYRWSSHLSYQTNAHYQSILNTHTLRHLLGSAQEQEDSIAHVISSPELAKKSSLLE